MESYKHKDGKLTSTELTKKIDWEKAQEAMGQLTKFFNGFGFTPPEQMVGRYHGFCVALNELARAMLLLDKTTVYETALRKILELDGSHVGFVAEAGKLAKEALEMTSPAPDRGEKLLQWLINYEDERNASIGRREHNGWKRLVILRVKTRTIGYGLSDPWTEGRGMGVTVDEAFEEALADLRRRVGA